MLSCADLACANNGTKLTVGLHGVRRRRKLLSFFLKTVDLLKSELISVAVSFRWVNLLVIAERTSRSSESIRVAVVDRRVGVERITTRMRSLRETERLPARCIRACWIVDLATKW